MEAWSTQLGHVESYGLEVALPDLRGVATEALCG